MKLNKSWLGRGGGIQNPKGYQNCIIGSKLAILQKEKKITINFLGRFFLPFREIIRKHEKLQKDNLPKKV